MYSHERTTRADIESDPSGFYDQSSTGPASRSALRCVMTCNTSRSVVRSNCHELKTPTAKTQADRPCPEPNGRPRLPVASGVLKSPAPPVHDPLESPHVHLCFCWLRAGSAPLSALAQTRWILFCDVPGKIPRMPVVSAHGREFSRHWPISPWQRKAGLAKRRAAPEAGLGSSDDPISN